MLAMAIPAFATPDTLTVATCAYTGIDRSLSAVTDDTLQFINNGFTVIEIANGGSEITATLVSQMATNYPNLPEGLAASNTTVTITATTGDKIIGPFGQRGFNDTNGYMMIILSGTTSVTAQARKVSNR